MQNITALSTALLIPAVIASYTFLDNRQKALRDDVDRKLEQSGQMVSHASLLLDKLVSTDVQQRKRALLFAVAYYKKEQIPPVILPMLAMTDAVSDPDVQAIFRMVLERMIKDTKSNDDETRGFAALALSKLTQGTGAAGSHAESKIAAVTASLDSMPVMNSEPAASSEIKQAVASTLTQGILAATTDEDVKVADVAINAAWKIPATQVQSQEKIISELPTIVREKVRPRIYVLGAVKDDEDTSLKLRRLRSVLQEKDFLALRVTDTDVNNLPNKTEVRYYVDEPSVVERANIIKAALHDVGIADVELKKVPSSANDAGSSQDIQSHFEVWLSKSESR